MKTGIYTSPISLKEKWKLFYPNLFISLTYIPASGSTEVEQKEKSGPAAKKLKLDPFGKPGTSGVSSTSKTRKFKGKDKGKLHFKLINYPVAWFF